MTEEQKAQIQALRAKIFSQLCKDLEEIEEYIEKLEEVAKAAITFDSVAVAHYTQEVEFRIAQDQLHAALDTIDWMRE